jgi:tetratricopeptide (TPR) repeat protein
MTQPAAAHEGVVPSTTIRFFLSSTFADFQTERDVLQQRVFPKLRELCAASSFRLQPIDLRWGVSEAAGTERQTLRICFDELERCRAISPDVFLLIQLGNRYGSYILPPEVPADLAKRLLAHCAPAERDRFAAAYRLDENAVPPVYVLLRAEGPERAEDEALRAALERAGASAGVSEDERLLFGGSATHREIQLGLLGVPEGAGWEAGVLCAARTFQGEPRGPEAKRFAEQDPSRVARVQRLSEAVLARLPASQVLRYVVGWPNERGPAFDEVALAEAYMGLLRPKLESVISQRRAARAALAARGRDEVALANASFERDRAAQVVGRKAEVARLVAYLRGESGATSPLVLTGAAGSGKSTLLAAAAVRAAATQLSATLVVRYCGVTPGTGNLLELLNDLHRTMARAYGRPEPQQVNDENELVAAVARDLAAPGATSARPLLLLVDAIDQLNLAAARNDWLPAQLGPHVRVVVSILDGRPELVALRASLPAGQIISLGPLDRSEGEAMLRGLLSGAPPRALAQAQQEVLLRAFAAQGLPLYLRLMAAEARRWRSFDPPTLGNRQLPQTVPDLLDVLLERLEAKGRHGRMLVVRSLGNLAAAVYGLAEDEALDLLARDAEVRAAQHDLSPNSPEIDPKLPLPVALWARLTADIGPLEGEREMDGMRLATFYHQQLRAAAQARYLAGAAGPERSRALAEYFASQPWRLSPDAWNWRKVRELARQQEQAGEWKAADKTLSDLAATLEQAWAKQAGGRGRNASQGSANADDINALIHVVQDRLTTGGHGEVGLRAYLLKLTLARAVGDRWEEGATLSNLGALAIGLGRFEEASNYFQQALVVFRELGDRAAQGKPLDGLGNLAVRQGRFEEASNYFQQALVVFRELGDRKAEGRNLNNLGTLASNQRRPGESRGYYQQALAIARTVGDRPAEGTILGNLGDLAAEQGRPEEASGYYEQALAVARAAGDRPAEGKILSELGYLATEQGRPEEGVKYVQEALAIARAAGDRPQERRILYRLGTLAYGQGRPERALYYYEQALAIVREMGDRSWEGTILGGLGAVAADQGRLAEAAKYFQQSLAIARATDDRSAVGTALNNLGVLAGRQGRPEEARGYYEQALAVAREMGDRSAERSALNNLEELTSDQGRTGETLANLAAVRKRRGWRPFGR